MGHKNKGFFLVYSINFQPSKTLGKILVIVALLSAKIGIYCNDCSEVLGFDVILRSKLLLAPKDCYEFIQEYLC